MIQRFNSTIGIKMKKCKSCGNAGPIFSKGRCAQCAKIEDTKSRFERMEQSEIVSEDLSGIKDDLDAIVSRYIRIKYANEYGMSCCYTCGCIKHFTKMQCSHFIPRAHLSTRWLESNLRSACSNCNEVLRGNLEVYAANLDKELPGLSEWLKQQSREISKPGREELKMLLVDYRAKLRIVESKLKK